MIITEVAIRNFKSFGPDGQVITFEPLTALVGENNTGKSNIIQAIDLFRNYSKTKVSESIFYNHDLNGVIEIKVTYGHLTEEERKRFRRHLSPDGTLTIVQRIRANPAVAEDEGAKRPSDAGLELDPVEEKTASITRSGIDWLDDPPTTKRDIAKLWKEEPKVGNIDFKAWTGLPADVPPEKEVLAAKVADFWDQFWDAIPKEEQDADTKPLGWPSKLMGNLPQVVYVPAVKKIEEETKSTKSAPFGALLNWMTKSIQADLRSQVQGQLTAVFRGALDSLPKDLVDEEGEPISRLELINRTLNQYVLEAFGCQLEVGFEEPQVDDTIFGSTILRADDGFRTDIRDKGHGLQRATMLTIVRTYLALRPQLEAQMPGLGRVIFVIEEPEIYLHPTVKRSAYALFRELVEQGDQVIYSTHDGYMLDVQHFDEIRVIRKLAAKPAPLTCVEQVSAEVLLEVWRHLSGRDDISLESVRAHLCNVYDAYRNEGFLASKVLLCEGPTERMALPIYFQAIDFDLDEHNIAVVDAGSVDWLDCFYLLFTELGIPVYVIWDSDTPTEPDVNAIPDESKRKSIHKKSRRNHDLSQLLGVPCKQRKDGCWFYDEDTIADQGAVFAIQYEATMMTMLPDSEQVRGEATRLYGTDSKPLTARYYAIKAVERGEQEGDRGKYVPHLVRDVAERLRALGTPEKQSAVLGIRDPC